MSDAEKPEIEERHLNDVATLRALSHPIRVKLYETLAMEGPLTATQAGELIGESPSTCSFHLRQLAKYGFVEEAGNGKGRQRPWQAKPQSLHIETSGDNPEVSAASRALGGLWEDRHLGQLRTWRETDASYPKQWRDAASDSASLTFLTPDELQELGDEFHALMGRYVDRVVDPSKRPAGALPVMTLVHAFPLRPPRNDDPPGDA